VQELADAHPRAAEALAKLHQAYRESNAAAADLALRATGEEGASILSPLEEVRDALDAASNYFPAIEDACDRFRASLDESSDLGAALTARLKSSHGAAVRLYDDAVMGGALRRFDFHARKLLLSDLLEPAGRVFHLAVTLVNLELGDVLDQEAHRAAGLSDDARAMLRSTLASYAAAALMMPYQPFFEAAERSRYDIDALRRRFEVSFEQVCHRLTTLHRPGARGVSFFMIRTDQAGNVTKRFGGGVLAFARSGGGCVRWRLFDVFRTPEQLHVQGLELTDGSRFISISRAVARPLPDGGAALNAVAVGCEVSDADRIVYEPGQHYTPIGLSCRLCDRNDCAVRAFPPMQRALRVDPHLRGAAPFSFGED
jgi:predicted transcriptional regulator